jgi:phytoene synthase
MDPSSGSLQKKTSFYYPLLLLPRGRRRALESLYRFCWEADDIADRPGPSGPKRRKLSLIRRSLAACFAGKPSPELGEFAGTVREFRLSREPLERILQGVERDLKPVRFRTFRELHGYALQVAGGPGLASMEIFGHRGRTHRAYAENLGVFLQIVNVVRDLREDADLGRRYLPLEDFRRFSLDPGKLRGEDPRWVAFVGFQLERANQFLLRSRSSLSRKERGELSTAEAIAAVYEKLAEKLRRDPPGILRGRIRLSFPEKTGASLTAWVKCRKWSVLG